MFTDFNVYLQIYFNILLNIYLIKHYYLFKHLI